MQLETIVASPQQATLDSGATGGTATITFNEAGEVDLARLQVQAVRDAPTATGIGNVCIDITPICRVSAITLNGAELFVRGRNTANPPAGVFHPLRARNFVQLPKIRVGSGDTLAVTLFCIQTALVGRFAISAPFAPDRFRSHVDAGIMRTAKELWAGSPEAILTNTDGTIQALTCTFDTAGLIDLSRTVLKVSALLTADSTTVDMYDAEQLDNIPVFVSQYILRSDYNIVTGAGTPTAAHSFMWNRSHNFFNLGIHKVQPGDTLVLTVGLYGGALLGNASASFGVPLLPFEGFGGQSGNCVPCNV